MPLIRSALSALARAAGATFALGVDANGKLIGPGGDVAPLTSRALAGRYAPRGRRKLLLGGSETARGSRVKAAAAGQITFNSTTKVATVVTNNAHGLHTGANIFLASEDCVAPGLNGGVITVDNMIIYGSVTVVDNTTFTVPYWSALAGTVYYDTGTVLNGTNTVQFYIFCQEMHSPNGKINEANRLLGHPYRIAYNIATGSNNSSHMVERIPAIVALAKANLITSVDGTMGVGNTALYGLSHSWTIAQIITQILSDVTAMVSAWAPYGIETMLEIQVAQLNSTGITIGGTVQIVEALRRLAEDQSLRLTLVDDYSQSYDPTTGLERGRYARNGNDNVHPSNEGAVHYAAQRAESQRGVLFPHTEFLARNPLDSYFADTTLTKQYFDPLTATTPTNAASGLDSKCTGVVPDLVTSLVTTGNAGRSAVFSYVKIGENYAIVGRLTSAAGADTFKIRLTNAAGSRNLATILNTLAGHTFRAGAEFSLIPLTGSWFSIDTYFSTTESYGSITNRTAFRAADTLNDGVYNDGPMTGPRHGPARLPDFTLPAGGSVSDAGLSFDVGAQTAGTAILIIMLPTLRDVTP